MTFEEKLRLSQELEGAPNREFYINTLNVNKSQLKRLGLIST